MAGWYWESALAVEVEETQEVEARGSNRAEGGGSLAGWLAPAVAVVVVAAAAAAAAYHAGSCVDPRAHS